MRRRAQPSFEMSWPKVCECGKQWEGQSWSSLAFGPQMPDHDGGLFELRRCTCGCVMAVRLRGPEDAR